MVRFVFGLFFLLICMPPCFIGAHYYKKKARRAQEDGGANTREARNADDLRSLFKWAGVGALAFGIILVAWSTVRIVPANHVGIPTTFGQIGQPMNSGIHFVEPWTQVNTFSTRMQESSMLGATDEGDKAKDDSIEVRGSDGYKMNVDTTVRYFIESDSAAELFRLVGSEDGIRERLVRPEIREAVRVAFANYTAEEGYTSQREAIRSDIAADLTARLAKYGLRLDSIAIRNVAPDVTLAKAISDRAAAREKALQATIEQQRLLTEAETRKQVAETDAQAAVIAAEGQAEANRILAESLTPEVLEAQRIAALRDANTVYMPYGSDILVAPVQQ